MKKATKYLGMLILAFALACAANENPTYAYSLENLGDAIENPNFFDNQYGEEYSGGVIYNAKKVYLDPGHTSFQMRARKYNPEKNVNEFTEDFKWYSCDDRICTVDQTGLIKAGEMTGATLIILETDTRCHMIEVVNRTGKYDEWYENMWYNTTIFDPDYEKSDYKTTNDCRKVLERFAETYKIYVDAYLEYGDRLHTDKEFRLQVMKDAIDKVSTAFDVKNKYGSTTWANCVQRSGAENFAFAPFVDKETNSGCGRCTVGVSHCATTIALDGVIYHVDQRNYIRITDVTSSDWKWDDKNCLRGTYILRNTPGDGTLVKDAAIWFDKEDKTMEDTKYIELALTKGYKIAEKTY